MRLVMTLLVRDEEDILDANLEFHRAAGVDHVVATDNLSEDATPDILERYAAQGWLSWRRETDDDYSQHRWVTCMAREAAAVHGADWVINNDADEFWMPSEGPGDLKAVLAEVPLDVGGLKVPRVEFLTRPDGPEPFYDRLTVRFADGVKPDGKRLLPKVLHRADADVEVVQGNHDASGPLLGPIQDTDQLLILHAPNRSYRQLANKIEKGGRAYANNQELPQRMGKRWRMLYERYQAGTLEAWYRDQILTEDEVGSGLSDGTFVVDERLREFFHDHRPEPRAPDAGRLRRLLQRGRAR